MSLFPPIHSERIAPGSFQQPVPIPAALPGEPPFVTVCFNAEWLPYILGCLFQLTLNTTWKATTQDELANAIAVSNNLILIFQQALPGCQTQNPAFSGAESGDEFMLRQNPDNPCLLETSVNGVDWCVWADLSKCTGQAQQPAKGSPNPPSGGCTNSFGTVEFGSRWMLPQNVSTGDVITVTNAVGTWASALDLYIPRCPDGNIFFEVGCVSGTGHTEPGDPAPSINHDSLIAFDGTNYYDCGPASDNTPVVITIPGGISNANLFFFANTPDTSGFGAVNFDVQYCNNQAVPWSSTLDFASNTYSSIVTVVHGTWVPGRGYESVPLGGPDTDDVQLTINFGASADLTYGALTYDSTANGSGPDNSVQISPPFSSGDTVLSGTNTIVKVENHTASSMDVSADSGSSSATMHLVRLVLHGTGTKPAALP
jgi:hypothetical protein